MQAALKRRKWQPVVLVVHGDDDSLALAKEMREWLAALHREHLVLLCLTDCVFEPLDVSWFRHLDDAVLCAPELLPTPFLEETPHLGKLRHLPKASLDKAQGLSLDRLDNKHLMRQWLRGDLAPPHHLLGTLIPILTPVHDFFQLLHQSLQEHTMVHARLWKEHQTGCGATTTLHALATLFAQQARVAVFVHEPDDDGPLPAIQLLENALQAAKSLGYESVVIALDQGQCETSDGLGWARLNILKIHVLVLEVCLGRQQKTIQVDAGRRVKMLDHTVHPVCSSVKDVDAVVGALKKCGFSSDALDAARDAAVRELRVRHDTPEAVPQFNCHLFVFGLAALRSEYTPARKLVAEVMQKSPIPAQFWETLAFLTVYAAQRGLETTEEFIRFGALSDLKISSDWLANEPLLMIDRRDVFCFVHSIFARLVLSMRCNKEFDKLLHLRPQIVSRTVLQETWTATAEYISTRFKKVEVQRIVRDVIIERTNTLSTFVHQFCSGNQSALQQEQFRAAALKTLEVCCNQPTKDVLGAGHTLVLRSRVLRLWASKLPSGRVVSDLATEAIRAAEKAVTEVDRQSHRMARNNFAHIRLTCGIYCPNAEWICAGLDGLLELLRDEQHQATRDRVLKQVACYADRARSVTQEADKRIKNILDSLSPRPSSPNSPASKSPSLSLFPDHHTFAAIEVPAHATVEIRVMMQLPCLSML